jgi:hypothetical protein
MELPFLQKDGFSRTPLRSPVASRPRPPTDYAPISHLLPSLICEKAYRRNVAVEYGLSLVGKMYCNFVVGLEDAPN